jgi:hypothetical protein
MSQTFSLKILLRPYDLSYPRLSEIKQRHLHRDHKILLGRDLLAYAHHYPFRLPMQWVISRTPKVNVGTLAYWLEYWLLLQVLALSDCLPYRLMV